jgi:serine phosphatase RsbU (regulator of sigma subunit)
LLAACGIIAGFISRKVREAVVSSLQSKNDLINRLDVLVNEKTAEIRIQKEEIQQKNKDITDSINYARRIQRALLASDDLLKGNLDEHFIIYEPKDVVSGDFFWASSLENGHFAVVVADSTGHGVPGAIMSMLNIACLRSAVETEELTSPAEILDHARKMVIGTLANDGSQEGGKDGMDCSVMVFDLKKKMLRYSAANHNLWLVRNGTLQELESDKMPVGKHDRDSEPFREHVLQIEKGDLIYAATDGFADQFGGPSGKKFMYRRLKTLLSEISHLSLSTQQEMLLRTFNDWKGTHEQVDDVTLVCIKA